MIREAYEGAAATFVDTVGTINGHQWQGPGLGVWTVRDLVGHASRAFLTVEGYLSRPAPAVELRRPVDYYLQVKAQTRAGLNDPAAIAARGREAGEALGAEPAGAVRDVATRVLATVRATADDVIMGTPVGGMRLIDYLPSRVFELGIHTLDLARALGMSVTLPDATAALSLRLMAELAAEQPGKAAPLLLAATGRGALPDGYSVL
ncbi:MAG TPA: maleylpyruvate isomerase N-terminal domain-containing protein [Candidatus Binatia bacterium]|nr:maleylpyruvate isomerase N-terminal domain-containing protein [Candidatus Binatia bacterium]